MAAFPAAIYRFYTSDEAQRLLDAAGFTDIEMVRYRMASRDIVFAVGHRELRRLATRYQTIR